MKLYFKGHEEKYALEQSLLAFFPEERPVYDEPLQPEESYAKVSLSEGARWLTAVTVIGMDGRRAAGISRWLRDDSLSEYDRQREKQRILKLSFFKAARELTGVSPAWGALTGIRPGKMAARLLEKTGSVEKTDRALRDVYFVSPERRRLCIETAQQGLKAAAELKEDEISLYVGIPFCPTRCAYCSFVSNSVERSFRLVQPYLDGLHAEVEQAARLVKELGLKIKSFYMGGGTPTTLTAAQMDELLCRIRKNFDLNNCVEYTIEAGRPDTIDRDKMLVLKDHGTTRVSINPQTMEDHVLRAIGRRHTAAEIEQAMELVKAVGFDHVNMDLIAGLPEDTAEGFCRSLDRVLQLGADNVTVHTLSLKKGSRLTLEGSRIPDAAEVGRMLDYANPTLRKAGFAPYYLYRQKYMSGSFENVGWSLPGAEGLYNIYIMEELHTILSLGAGGSTKMVRGDRIERVFNLKYPQEYIDRPEKIRENHRAFAAFYCGECSEG